MDRRRVFDRVKEHLLTQGSKSENWRCCLYRGEGGKMCAVGCLIPDAKYDPSMEAKNVRYILVREVLESIFGVMEPLDIDFLHHLQSIHDDCPVAEWSKELDSSEKRWL